MTEKPILFSTDTVKGILADRKTVTRRVCNDQVAKYRYQLKTKPRYQKGDLLWTRETFAFYPDENHVIYRAREGIELAEQGIDLTGCWKSPRFMPKIYARIWLEVLDVRAERLQEISLEDCYAEGIESQFSASYKNKENIPIMPLKKRYKRLWDSLNAKRGYPWDNNPWIWRYEFKRIEHTAGYLPNPKAKRARKQK